MIEPLGQDSGYTLGRCVAQSSIPERPSASIRIDAARVTTVVEDVKIILSSRAWWCPRRRTGRSPCTYHASRGPGEVTAGDICRRPASCTTPALRIATLER